MLDIGRLKFDKSGLIPAIIQDVNTRVVLMQGYMDEISVRRTSLCLSSIESSVITPARSPYGII